MPQENKYSKTLNFITESQLSLTFFQLHFFVFNFQCHCEFNKLTPVFHASVLLLIMNFAITLSK